MYIYNYVSAEATTGAKCILKVLMTMDFPIQILNRIFCHTVSQMLNFLGQ